MKILFLAAYSNLVAASRIKVYQFFPLLEEKGIKCKAICFTPSFLYRIRLASATNKGLLLAYYPLNYAIRFFKTILAILMAPSFDIVFVQEPIIPFGLEKILKLVNNNIIFQFTDAVFLESQTGDNFLEKIRLKTLSKYCRRMASVAKCCLVENDYNKDAVLKICPCVDKITGPIDTDRYFLKRKEKKDDKIIIGWIGSPFTTKYLYIIEDALKEISKKYKIVLRLVGARKDFKILEVPCEMKNWTIDTEVSWLQTFDIGIMPLIDDEWTKGKAGYKLLQYMAMGIPSVVSPVGFNIEIVKDGFNGFLAGNKSEWVEKLSTLIEDKKLRENVGDNARTTIEENYSLKRAASKLSNIFKNTLNNQV